MRIICNFFLSPCNTFSLSEVFVLHMNTCKKPVRHLVTHMHSQEISFFQAKSCLISQIPLIPNPRNYVLVSIIFKKSRYCRKMTVKALSDSITAEHFSLELYFTQEIVPIQCVLWKFLYFHKCSWVCQHVSFTSVFSSHEDPYNL